MTVREILENEFVDGEYVSFEVWKYTDTSKSLKADHCKNIDEELSEKVYGCMEADNYYVMNESEYSTSFGVDADFDEWYSDGSAKILVITIAHDTTAYVVAEDYEGQSNDLLLGAFGTVADAVEYIDNHEDNNNHNIIVADCFDYFDGNYDVVFSSTEYKILVTLMDDEIREEVHRDLAPCNSLDFLAEYQKRHLDKYGCELRSY